MVNYCCVKNCNRNSRLNRNLNFYCIPKERQRQMQWLKAAGREDLLSKNSIGICSYRICSRHFTPSNLKNRNLSFDAAPTLYMPGDQPAENTEEDPLTHSDIICNSCESPVVGYRYKCVTCVDYDLCVRCEKTEMHPEHFMLRIPKPMKMKLVDNLVKKWREFFKSEHMTPNTLKDDQGSSDSSDDEPITKYKNYDSGVDLSEDVKEKIRKEVQRVIKKKTEDEINRRIINQAEEINSLATKRQEKIARQLKYKERMLKQAEVKKKRQAEEQREMESKRMKLETSTEQNELVAPIEVHFDNVNQTSNLNAPVNPAVDLKPEFSVVPSVTSSNLHSVPAPSVTYSFVPGMIPVSFVPLSEPGSSLQTSSVNTVSRLLGVSVSQTDVQTGPAGSGIETGSMGTGTIMTGPMATGPTVLCPSTLPSVLGIPLSEIPLASSSNPDQNQSPVMHVKLSDDLTQLMIEVTSNNQKTLYAYSDK